MSSFGVLLPTREAAMVGQHELRSVVKFAARARDAGFTSAWAGDSLTARPRGEPLTMLAAVAGAVPDMGLGTAALTAALRHPLSSAHVLTTLDRLAEGNLIVGVGAGFPYPASQAEFGSVGIPFAGRYRRLDETVSFWRALWRQPRSVRFEGQVFSYSGPAPEPPPVSEGGPPVWLAGGGAAALRRVGRLYDGWLPYPPTTDAYRSGWETIVAAAVEAGRAEEAVTPGLYVTVNLNEDGHTARDELDRYCRAYYDIPLEVMQALQAFCGGGVAEIVDWLGRYLALGVSQVVVRIGSSDRDRHLDGLAEVLDRLTP